MPPSGNAAVNHPSILPFGNKHTAMPGTKKYTVVLTLDQVAELLDQLSDADTVKVVKRLRQKPRSEAVDELIAVLSKVKMSEKDVTALVEEVRTGRFARQKVRSDGR
jgi:hypothetical protein